MAKNDFNTERLLDPFVNLLESYEALAHLAYDHGLTDDPVLIILDNLNKQFRLSVELSDRIHGGLLS